MSTGGRGGIGTSEWFMWKDHLTNGNEIDVGTRETKRELTILIEVRLTTHCTMCQLLKWIL